jgi:VanZ family protein
MATMRFDDLPLIVRWLPAVFIMMVIFMFSSLPASRLPYYGSYDLLIKKGGHAIGYGLLGLAYFFALPPSLRSASRWTLSLMMAILFGLSDEFHESFVAGRNSSLVDVAIDAVGAALFLTLAVIYSSNSRSKSRD